MTPPGPEDGTKPCRGVAGTNVNGSTMEIDPADYKKALPIPSSRHPCRVCGKPANYRTRYMGDLKDSEAMWLCPECFKEIAKQLDEPDSEPDNEPRVKVISEYADEDRITHMEKTIRAGVIRGRKPQHRAGK